MSVIFLNFLKTNIVKHFKCKIEERAKQNIVCYDREDLFYWKDIVCAKNDEFIDVEIVCYYKKMRHQIYY